MKKSNKRLDFLPNRQNKYSIRKFTVGTASILVELFFYSVRKMMRKLRKLQQTVRHLLLKLKH